MVDIKVVVNGKDISVKFKEHFTSLSIVDNAGTQSDELNISLTNAIKRPAIEDAIEIWIAKKYYGLYLVSSTKTNHLNMLMIKATSANFTKSLKSKKNTNHFEITLGDLVAKVAKEHGLEVKFDFENLSYTNLVQDKESNMHMLNRLADKYDALFAIKNNTLIFIKRDVNLPIFTMDLDECFPWEIERISRKEYGSCKATWRDTKENMTLSVTAGGGEPTLTQRGSFSSEAEALLVAKGELAKTKRGTKEGSLSKKGEYFSAGSKMFIINSKQDDGEYTMERVSTTVDRRGFRVSIDFKA